MSPSYKANQESPNSRGEERHQSHLRLPNDLHLVKATDGPAIVGEKELRKAQRE